jgi:hypothetical protein
MLGWARGIITAVPMGGSSGDNIFLAPTAFDTD